MKAYATLPFTEAITKRPGDYVTMGGVARRILAVDRHGRNEPYYVLDGVPADHPLCNDAPGLISWQVLGDARPEAATSCEFCPAEGGGCGVCNPH